MGTPGQFIEQAMLSGFKQGEQQREQRKQALSDEEHEQALTDKNNTIASIQQQMAQVGPDHPEYGALQNRLTQTVEDRTRLFHPDTPGGLHRLGELVWKRVHGQQPQAPMETTPTAPTPGGSLPSTTPVTTPGLPGTPSTTLPAMGGTAVPQMPAVPGVAVRHPVPTPADLKARAAQELAWGAPAPPVNPLVQARQQMTEAGFTPEQIEKAMSITAGIEAKPTAAHVAAPKWQVFKHADGSFHEYNLNDPDKQPPEGAVPVTGQTMPHQSAAAQETFIRSWFPNGGNTQQREWAITRYQRLLHPGSTSSHESIQYDADGNAHIIRLTGSSSKDYGPEGPPPADGGVATATSEAAASETPGGGIPLPIAPARPGGVVAGVGPSGNPVTIGPTGQMRDQITGKVTQLPGRPTSTAQRSPYMAVPNPKGLVESGNLPIWNRPTVRNADGTHSSEYSTSFADDQGREVLVPTVVNGKFLTPDGKKPPEGSPQEKAMFQRAWQHYLATGENLGKFDNAANANSYANILHNRGNPPTAGATPADLKARVATARSATGAVPPTVEPKVDPRLAGLRHATPAMTTADKAVNAATGLVSLADDALAAPSAAKDKNLALAIIRGAAGRVNMQEYNIMTQRAGLGNTLEAWANSATTGQLPADIRKQLVDVAHSSLKAAQAGQAQSRRPAGSTTTYKQTATGPNNHKIGSNDGGNTWFDVQTGQPVQVP